LTRIAKLDAGVKGAIIAFHNNSFPEPEKLLNWISGNAGTVIVRPDQRLVVIRAWEDTVRRLEGVKRLLGEIKSLI